MKILIDDKYTLSPEHVEPLSKPKRWSPGLLAGYQLSITVDTQRDFDLISNEFKGRTAKIDGEPHQYIVSVYMRQSSTTNGKLTSGQFDITLMEEELRPSLSEIDLNGLTFAVKDFDTQASSESSVYSFLLTLDKEEFDALEHILVKHDTSLKLMRVGVDTEPIDCRIGGANYWSLSKDGHQFTRIINCVAEHEKGQMRYGLYDSVRGFNLEREVLKLSLQVKFLANKLAHSLTPEDIEILESPQLLLDASGSGSFWFDLEKIRDAETYFRDNRQD